MNTDESLAGIAALLDTDLASVGLPRQRGGIARGVAWFEASGRAADGSWLELRIHHRPTEQCLRAGLLAYQPLSRGGKTLPLGDTQHAYRNSPSEVTQDVVDDIRGWLGVLA